MSAVKRLTAVTASGLMNGHRCEAPQRGRIMNALEPRRIGLHEGIQHVIMESDHQRDVIGA